MGVAVLVSDAQKTTTQILFFEIFFDSKNFEEQKKTVQFCVAMVRTLQVGVALKAFMTAIGCIPCLFSADTDNE